MDTSDRQTESIIIGGGLAGLSAAWSLARAGRKVTLFERSATLGGRSATQEYAGYAFNRGGHALYRGGAATEVLRELGIACSGRSPTGNFAHCQGHLYPYPGSAFDLLKSPLLSGQDKLELAGLFLRLPRLEPASFRFISVRDWLKQVSKRPRVHTLMIALAHTLTYSAALDQVSADVLIGQAQLLLKHNVFYIDGGWQVLVDSMHRQAERLGAQVRSGQRVEAILHQDGRVQGVRLRSGETVDAASVIIAAGPRDASALIDEGRHPSLQTLASRLQPLHVACLDVALRHVPAGPRYQAVLDLDRPRFQAFQSLTARIAPEGGGLIHTFKYLDPASPSDPREDERDLEDLLATLVPGWKAEVVRQSFLPRMEVVNAIVTASGGGLHGRPGPEVEGIAGLYLAGDWVGSEGYLLDASLASARQAAQLVLATHPLLSDPLGADDRLLCSRVKEILAEKSIQ